MREEAARLRWRCRRGMREVELLLEGFLDREFHRLDGEQRAAFARLLESPDQQLLAYFHGRAEPVDDEVKRIVARIRSALS